MTSAEVPDSVVVHRTPSKTVVIPLQTLAVASILTVFGIALIFQSGRWQRTPAYGNLLQIFPAHVWGIIHLVIAALIFLGLMIRVRIFSIFAHTFAFVLLATWAGAFVIRYLTDANTTIVNVVSWAVYLFLLVWSGKLIDRYAPG